MALTPEEDDLYRVAKSALPRFLFPDGENETIAGFAKLFGLARLRLAFYLENSYILRAVGFWLDQHAKDRGTSRRIDETDDALRARLRTVEDALTPPALEAAINAVLAAAGLPDGALVELRVDRAFFHPALSAQRAYASRGYRTSRSTTRKIIAILPYGTPTEVAASIREALRGKKAAGIVVSIETRGVP